MENLQQEPWTEEEWDAWIKRVLAEGDTDVEFLSADSIPFIRRMEMSHPPIPYPAFDPDHPVPVAVRADPQHPLNIIQQEEQA